MVYILLYFENFRDDSDVVFLCRSLKIKKVIFMKHPSFFFRANNEEGLSKELERVKGEVDQKSNFIQMRLSTCLS